MQVDGLPVKQLSVLDDPERAVAKRGNGRPVARYDHDFRYVRWRRHPAGHISYLDAAAETTREAET